MRTFGHCVRAPLNVSALELSRRFKASLDFAAFRLGYLVIRKGFGHEGFQRLTIVKEGLLFP